MAIVPQDLLTQAEGLLRQADGLPDVPQREALLRAAVSRAYYAVYHLAFSLAQRQGSDGFSPGYASHEGLWDGWFGVREEDAAIANAGHLLKRERTRADYRLRETFSLTGAKRTVADAQLAFDLIRAR